MSSRLPNSVFPSFGRHFYQTSTHLLHLNSILLWQFYTLYSCLVIECSSLTSHKNIKSPEYGCGASPSTTDHPTRALKRQIYLRGPLWHRSTWEQHGMYFRYINLKAIAKISITLWCLELSRDFRHLTRKRSLDHTQSSHTLSNLSLS